MIRIRKINWLWNTPVFEKLCNFVMRIKMKFGILLVALFMIQIIPGSLENREMSVTNQLIESRVRPWCNNCRGVCVYREIFVSKSPFFMCKQKKTFVKKFFFFFFRKKTFFFLLDFFYLFKKVNFKNIFFFKF